MGQKSNPISLRLQLTNRHFESSWYSDYFYKNLMTREISLQSYLDHFLKSLKLPLGRYSVQYLQKKTQMYSFFCYPKSTRQWRLDMYGLTKTRSFLKKNRFFFKARLDKKTKRKFSNLRISRKNFKTITNRPSTGVERTSTRVEKASSSLFHSFYSTKNQHQLYKIQRKLTSFQNFKLWSTFLSPHRIKMRPLSPFFAFLLHQKNARNFIKMQPEGTLSISQIEKNQLSQLTPFKNLFEKKQFSPISLKLDTPLKSRVETDTTSFLGNSRISKELEFLPNLYLYNILKSNWKNSLIKSSTFSPAFFHGKTAKELREKKWSYPVQRFSPLETSCKNYLESQLSFFYGVETNLIPFRVSNDWQCAQYLADEIVYFLQKRIPFRRLKTRLLRQLSEIPQIRGVRITCSGRVGGKSKKAQRAKTECIKYGQTSLQVFSSKIDFSKKTAFTGFGSVGVKVWICFN
jgi:hypothetical protein